MDEREAAERALGLLLDDEQVSSYLRAQTGLEYPPEESDDEAMAAFYEAMTVATRHLLERMLKLNET